MRISASGSGARLELVPAEVALLAQLLGELETLLDPDARADVDAALGIEPADAVRGRLFPEAYRGDPAAQETFAEITRPGLEADRASRIDQCRADLAAARGRRHLRLDLDRDAVERWLRVLNDVRLALGTLLGVTEDQDWDLDALPTDDPDAQRRAGYVWLTAVQDGMVRALMGD